MNMILMKSFLMKKRKKRRRKKETIQVLKKRIKKPRTKVVLTKEGRQLRDSIYNLIKNKKSDRVLKHRIFLYHKQARLNDDRITPIKREENRSVNIYFNKHSKEREFIIKQFDEMQKNGIINYKIDNSKF